MIAREQIELEARKYTTTLANQDGQHEFGHRLSGKMKAVTIFVLVALLFGCVSRQQATVVVPPVHVAVDVAISRGRARENPIATAIANAVFGPETAAGHLVLGCGYFLETNGRWPRTKEEVSTGLASADISPAKLTNLEELRFREEADALIIDFVSTENGRAQGSVTIGREPEKA